MNRTETVYHITVLSNFVRGFDKYRRVYSKKLIPESTYPGQFYVLREDELETGASNLNSGMKTRDKWLQT